MMSERVLLNRAQGKGDLSTAQRAALVCDRERNVIYELFVIHNLAFAAYYLFKHNV